VGHNLLSGLTALGSGSAVALLIVGTFVGVFLGVIPGLGVAIVLSIMLAFIYHLGVVPALALMLATQAGSYFSASITAILLNTPGAPESLAVTFDGFPMAERGEAGRALGISATSTMIGGLIGCAGLVGFLQVVNRLPSIFHPPEYMALVLLALILVGTLGTDSVSKGLISAAMGLMIAAIGPDSVNGLYRYTFHLPQLYGGVSIVPLALGSFAIPQMVMLYGTGGSVAKRLTTGVGGGRLASFGTQVLLGVKDACSHLWVLVRGALVGTVCGIVPGIGGFTANFLSYGIAEQSSRKKREQFGTGLAEGIIAPESSSLSKEAGSLIPVIGLGLPSGLGSVLLLAAMTILGLEPGFGFTKAHPSLPYTMMWTVALGGLLGTAVGLLAAPILARVTRTPGPLLLPFIMALAILGPYASTSSMAAVIELLVFAMIGLALRRLNYSLAAFAVGLVLGPTFEDNVYLTQKLFGWRFVERPLADVLLVAALVVLVLKTMQFRRQAALRRRAEAGDAAELGTRQPASSGDSYPLLSLLATTCILVVAVAFTVYGILQYNFVTVLMPAVAGSACSAVALWRLPQDLRRYLSWRRHRGAEIRSGASVPGPEGGDGATSVEVTRVAAPGLALVLGDGLEGGPSLSGQLLLAGHGITGGEVDALAEAAHPQGAHDHGADARLGVLDRETGSDTGPEGSEAAPGTRDGRVSPIPRSWARHGQYMRELVAIGWLLAAFALVYLFGFVAGIAAFCGLYGISATGLVLPSWPKRVMFAVGALVLMGGATYVIFQVLHLSYVSVVSL
jgi:putative tricarboxylic transport membrane protein